MVHLGGEKKLQAFKESRNDDLKIKMPSPLGIRLDHSNKLGNSKTKQTKNYGGEGSYGK